MTGDEYARAVGERLRGVRTDRGMSLGDVEEASGRLWKAAVVGAYERGDRNITVARLFELAGFYGVSVADVLPEPAGDQLPLRRLVNSILERRGEPAGGGEPAIRENDLLLLSLLSGTPPEELARRLEERGSRGSGS